MLQDVLSLKQREIEAIQGFEKGQALIVGGGNNVVVKVVASKLEHSQQQTARNAEKSEEMTPGELLSASRQQARVLMPLSRKNVKL